MIAGAEVVLATDDARAWLGRIGRDTSMGHRVAAFDWAATSLGDPSTWSIGLRNAVATCMTSRFPMLVVWGPDLVKIYNDGYAPILGARHPDALGRPAAEVWPEIWHQIGPDFDAVVTTGEPTWHEHELLVLERNGYAEECFFVWSYSPLFDDDGSIGGVLDVVTESTQEVVARRRLSTLTDLSAALVDAEQVTDVCVRAVAALAMHREDVASAAIHLRVGDELVRIATNGREPTLDPATLAEVATGSEPMLVGATALGPADAMVVPIGKPHAGVRGVVVAGLNPARPFDPAYAQFLDLVTASIGDALEAAFRRASEMGEYRRISDTLQAAMLQPASDLPTVAARYLPAVGSLAVGGDWYDVIDLGSQRRAVVVGDCVGHGLAAATVMGQLRSATRAMLLEGRSPGEVLDGLDLFAETLTGAFCATVVCAVIDRATDVVTYARAGHPPPLVVSASGHRWLDGALGTPLAIETGVTRTTATLRLEPDDVLLFFSDGLVERRGELLDVGLARLAAVAGEHAGESVQQLADAVLLELLPEGATDDVVLVVKSLPAEPH
ncbi:MAG: SpoIIE family protein phosphatase [Acidimicrobiales bacterium]|nr:SpoIIE family protein phosphatase [Acidimicrobiales bacterium]